MRRLVDPVPDEVERAEEFDDDMNFGLPHAGSWSRPAGEDVMRCRVHDLTPAQHDGSGLPDVEGLVESWRSSVPSA